WDERPLLRTYRQIQSIRLYYDFNDVDVDRYMIDGRYRQLMLSARELIVGQLPPQANTWVNRHLTYTHGYGLGSGHQQARNLLRRENRSVRAGQDPQPGVRLSQGGQERLYQLPGRGRGCHQLLLAQAPFRGAIHGSADPFHHLPVI
ncbi:MAG: UPF0182 family protein, partial [Deltaproteobacteria bacterium]|nr:UPF0182 family protein [Deltaproteobacteria bacterium]